MGVPPELVPDYLSLMGDAVDNIPGVAGIGAVTARALLRELGGIDAFPRDPAVWEKLELKNALRIAQRIEEGGERLALSRELVRLRDDLPLSAQLADLRYQGAERGLLEALLCEFGAQNMLERVSRWRDGWPTH